MKENSHVIETGSFPKFLLDGENSLQNIGQTKKSHKGTSFIAVVLILSALGIIGWAFTKFALPLIMKMLSPLVAAICAGFLVAFAYAIAKPTWKWFKAIADKLYKAAIRYNPEVAIQNKLQDFDIMIDKFDHGLATVKKSSANFETEAQNREQEASELKKKIDIDFTTLKAKKSELQTHKTKIAEFRERINKGELKTEREKKPYIEEIQAHDKIATEIASLESRIRSNKYSLESDMRQIESFAAKANIFKRWQSFLESGKSAIEDKKLEFHNWWKTVQKEIQAANAGKQATEALRFILRDDYGHDLDFNLASEYILDKINSDYAITIQNMDDLAKHIDKLDFNSEAEFSSLEELLNSFENGEKAIPSAIEISSLAHELTPSERASAGVLGNLFNN